MTYSSRTHPSSSTSGSAVQLEIRPAASGGQRFRVLGQLNEVPGWKTFVAGSIIDPSGSNDAPRAPAASDVAAIRSRTDEVPSDLLESWRWNGHAPAVTRLWLGQGEGVARLEGALERPAVRPPSSRAGCCASACWRRRSPVTRSARASGARWLFDACES